MSLDGEIQSCRENRDGKIVVDGKVVIDIKRMGLIHSMNVLDRQLEAAYKGFTSSELKERSIVGEPGVHQSFEEIKEGLEALEKDMWRNLGIPEELWEDRPRIRSFLTQKLCRVKWMP